MKIRFNRQEASGAIGDLGTLVPLALGVILLNGVSSSGTFFIVGIFYILAGLYYRVPTPVQPMKVITAYAIANYTQVSAGMIYAGALWMGIILLLLGVSGLVSLSRHVPKSVVRGVQLGVGTLLMLRGIDFMLSPPAAGFVPAYQHELASISIGGISAYMLLSLGALLFLLFTLDSRRIPAALVVIIAGFVVGYLLYQPELRLSPSLPQPLSTLPSQQEMLAALFMLVLPQLPMTIGNAIVAQQELARTYFGRDAERVTWRALSTSQGLANLGAFLFSGMPLCHGAGGLAAHYRFGARTAGNNIIIGTFFLLAALLFGNHAVELLKLLPFSVLGVLLFIAGAELMTMLRDLRTKEEFYVPMVMLGITLASNLGWAFIAGILLALLIQKRAVRV